MCAIFHIEFVDKIVVCSDESSLLMGDIDHIPQTEASYDRFLESIPTSPNPVGDMVREDLRDHIFKSEYNFITTKIYRLTNTKTILSFFLFHQFH